MSYMIDEIPQIDLRVRSIVREKTVFYLIYSPSPVGENFDKKYPYLENIFRPFPLSKNKDIYIKHDLNDTDFIYNYIVDLTENEGKEYKHIKQYTSFAEIQKDYIND